MPTHHASASHLRTGLPRVDRISPSPPTDAGRRGSPLTKDDLTHPVEWQSPSGPSPARGPLRLNSSPVWWHSSRRLSRLTTRLVPPPRPRTRANLIDTRPRAVEREQVSDLQTLATEALRLAALDPEGARTRAESVLVPARRNRAWNIVCVAERALGVAAMTINDVDQAVSHLRLAVLAGQRAQLTDLSGQARMSLASALVLRGLPNEASRHIETAVSELSGVPAARAHVQHAAILQELGRDEEAFVELRHALPLLRQAGDAEWEVRALSNRSLMHVGRRSFGAAEADLLAARRICLENHLELPAGYAEQNLGFVKSQRGDVPGSLRLFDDAADRYRRFGVVEPSLLLDRASVLLSVRLLDEARASADAAVAAYMEQKRGVHLPEAHLMLSTIALLQGDHAIACANGVAAMRGFRRLGHSHSLALARYAWIQAIQALNPEGVDHRRMARAAEDLEEAGWKVPALEARVLAGRIALDRGQRAAARKHLALASRARFIGPADARSRAWLAEALLRQADGRRTSAASALRAGLRIVEEYQATLGATELRAHVTVHRGSLAKAGLRMAVEDRNARGALWWAERGRASALFLRPAKPSKDPHLAQDLSDLRATLAEIHEGRSDGRVHDDALVRRQVVLEHRIRDRCRTLEGIRGADREGSRQTVAGLVGSFADTALVEFFELDHLLYAITVAGGRVRLYSLCHSKAVHDLIVRIPFALRRMAKRPGDPGGRAEAALVVLEHAAQRLDDLLLRPMSRDLSDRPIVIVPSSALQSMTWSILPSCHGRAVTVSPSATLWHQAEARAMSGSGALVVAGPALPGAAQEAAAVAALYPGSTLLMDESATASRLSASLPGASMLHLAAHGVLRADNPLFSSIRLADGPFTVYELEPLDTPRHVVLAGCHTGRLHVVGGDEVLGFGAALFGCGTSTLVAPVVPIPDAASVPLMLSYHQELLQGASPAEALARAQSLVEPCDPLGRSAAAGFVCLGTG